MLIQKIKYAFVATIATIVISGSIAHAGTADGIFGDYFTRMTGVCSSSEVLSGFDNSASSNFGNKTCTAIQTILGTVFGASTAPTGQAMTGFDASGAPKYGYINWINNGAAIGYTAGNVGIGTNSPTYKLDVTGVIRSDHQLLSQGGLGTDLVRIQPGDDLNPGYNALTIGNAAWNYYPVQLKKNGDSYFAGKMGIGISPQTKLDVPDGARLGSITVGDSSNIYGPLTYPYETFALPWNMNFRFAMGGTEVMSIQNNGGVGIGLATTASPTERLEVAGRVKATQFIDRDNTTYFLDPNNTSTLNNINASTVTATAFNYSSDKRLKKDITPLNDSLSKILSLNGYSYNWKSDNRKDIGVIAQEVETVFPELVHTNENGIKSVEYGNLVAPLIESIKAQQSQIDDLKAEIQELKNQQK